ncbi:Tfp pilus assembly protein FimT/FimU [Patescibacteria group bacterium]
MIRSSQRNFGFGLIEILVTTAIAGILFAGGMAAYRGMGERQGLKQAGASFQSKLRLYQQKALSGEKPEVCGSGDTFLGFRVSYDSTTSYLAQAICNLATPAAVTINLPTGVEFVAPFSPNEIVFSVLDSTLQGAQTIILTSGSFNYQVMIQASGVIKGSML